MSANKCARCELTVYPVEGLRCLDKLWHKGCFKCHECNMTLNLKNYKGFEKRPYCNAHCPQAKATTVADTPESRRLAENTRIQSQAKYHEDFEKSKGKGFTPIADDPETLRIKNTSKIISNVAYHGELERKKQMEERRGSKGHPDDVYQNNNNNNNNVTNHSAKQLNRNISQGHDVDLVSHFQVNNYPNQAQNQQQQKQQQQLLLQKQQQQLLQKQQQQQQQLQYVQDTQMNRHSQQFVDVPHQQASKLLPMSNPHLTQQQQLSARQQQQLMLQQQQLQHQHHLQQQQQQHHRHSMDSSVAMNRHQQAMSNNNPHAQQMIKNQMIPVHHQQQQQQQQPQMKYMPQMKDSIVMNQSPNHVMFAPAGQPRQHMMSPTNAGAIQNAHRISLPNQAMMTAASQQQMLRAYNPQQQIAIGQQQMNGMIAKQQQQQQQQQFIGQPQARQLIHSNQVPAMNIINVSQQHIRNPQQMHQQQQAQQMPRRVFRAMYDYVANDVDEVSFFENDILVDCVNVDGNWLVGKVARSGQTEEGHKI